MASFVGPDFVVKDIASFELSSIGRTAFRLEVKNFNGSPYVGLGQYFYQQDLNKWLPTKKQFYMPALVWKELPKHVDAVNRALANAADEGYDEPDGDGGDLVIVPSTSAGMNTIPRL